MKYGKEPLHKIDETFGNRFPISIYTVYTSDLDNMIEHTHEYMQIWYVDKGSCTHIVEGTEYRLPPKSLLILPPGVHHTITAESSDLRFIGCEFPLELVTEDNILPQKRGKHLMEFSYMEIFETAIRSTKACFIPSIQCQVEIEKILNDMLLASKEKYMFYEVSLKGYLLLFLSALARDYENSTQNRKISEEYKTYIESALFYIDSHYNEKLYIKDVAKSVAMSESYFSYFFKNVTNFSFVEYLNNVRINKAKELLENSAVSVSDICDAVGFSDEAYFNRVFKKLTGLSPTAYRKDKKR